MPRNHRVSRTLLRHKASTTSIYCPDILSIMSLVLSTGTIQSSKMFKIIGVLSALVAICAAKPSGAIVSAPLVAAAPAPIVTATSFQYYHRINNGLAAYVAPSAAYVAPSAAYVAPSAAYVAPSAAYVAPSAAYVAPSAAYVAPSAPYVAPSAAYVAPSAAYVAPSAAYVAQPAAAALAAPYAAAPAPIVAA
ncbi:cuticle protein 16.5-like [Galleria mellonella]|uniref:Cuticle protein 16.5-like n=1 Tax=Galleria mellonella TaxID=7137 RepID=A0A6J1X588_GALME|nr:cuticle protein 16.5-like [Galleria mellonella]